MDRDLDTIRWHVDRLMKHAGNTNADAHAELHDAFESLDQRLQNIDQRLQNIETKLDEPRQRAVLESALTDLAAETAQRQLEMTNPPQT